jgi:hypothetical protein
MGIEEEQIRFVFQLLPGRQHNRTFAEGEQTGDIGKCNWEMGDCALQGFEAGIAEDDDGGAGAAFLEAHIDAADRRHPSSVPRQDERTAKPLLGLRGLLWF